MALVNAGWCLASAGFRVLLLDWDLAAPSLHRFLHPFLADPELRFSDGLIELLLDFAAAAVAGVPDEEASDTPWFYSYAELSSWALRIDQYFPPVQDCEGSLYLMPAGRQGPHYAARVNAFDWNRFFTRLGGGIFLEALKANIRSNFDYILIDSCAGVSATAGICTSQMPDDLVTCFTLNRQGLIGAAAAAQSALNLRTSANKEARLRIWPVPSRIDDAEKHARDRMLAQAMREFSPLVPQIGRKDLAKYWGEVAVPYQPFYSYEEILPAVGDSPYQSGTILRATEHLLTWVTDKSFTRMPVLAEHVRRQQRSKFLPNEWDDEVSIADSFHRAFVASARIGDHRAAEKDEDRLQRKVLELARPE